MVDLQVAASLVLYFALDLPDVSFVVAAQLFLCLHVGVPASFQSAVAIPVL